ncbi:MAG: hypothetical protein K5644_07450 [Lachnospiraceae bacterium]|nr:hypothetical protein [Lachnospiraceae bacterium]
MKKINAIVSIVILILFTFHMTESGLALVGIYLVPIQIVNVLAWIMVGLVALHAIMGLISVIDSVKRSKDVSYGRENRLFWIRRDSGFVLLALIVCHVVIFMTGGMNVTQQMPLQMILSVLMVITLMIHILTNIKPLWIALGFYSEVGKIVMSAVMIIILAVLVFAMVAFSVYFLHIGG